MPHRKRQTEVLDATLEECTPQEVVRELKERWKAHPSDDNKRLQFASALSTSSELSDKQDSIKHFLYFLENGGNKNAFQRESLFLIARTHYALGAYEVARGYCEDLYRSEPDDPQVRQLHMAITYKHDTQMENIRKQRETTFNVVVGVGATAAAIALGYLLSPRRK
mmetsp:Transcript_6606/g.11086  ORF Transcript_6606/g.11086 Transcript_6606/m.11086 type:complete len:166 (+) Transcript_6606:85-582(+)